MSARDGDTSDFISKLIKEEKTSESGKRFAIYVSALKNIVLKQDKNEINRLIVAFLQSLFFDALIDHGILKSAIKADLCIAGSLARNQATPFSDIDCFLIFSDFVKPSEKEKIREVVKKIFFLANGLFTHTNQFCMDPLGISLSKLNGTVEELVDHILDLESVPMLTSISNARPVVGEGLLLKNLQSRLKEEKNIDYFHFVINDFKGPTSSESMHIKNDLIRPIDFLLQGFRENENMSVQEYPNSKTLLDELVRRNVISVEARMLIEQVQSETYHLRLKLHKEHGAEQDRIDKPDKSVKELVDLVGWLRGSLKEYQNKSHPIFDIRHGVYLSNNNSVVDQTLVELQKYTLANIKFTIFLEAMKKELNNLYEKIKGEENEQDMLSIQKALSVLNELKEGKSAADIYEIHEEVKKNNSTTPLSLFGPKVKSTPVTKLMEKLCTGLREREIELKAASPKGGRRPQKGVD